MKQVSVRELRQVLPRLERLLEVEGEVAVTCRGRAIARLVSLKAIRRAPSHLELREAMPLMDVGSETLVRLDRDER